MSLGNSQTKFNQFLKSMPGIPASLQNAMYPADAIQTGLLAFSWGHVGTDYVEIFISVKGGPTMVGVARTLSVEVFTEDAWLKTWSSSGWKVTADWKVSEETPEPTEPTGMFKAVKVEDFLDGKASVYERNGRVFLLTRHVLQPVELCSPDEDVSGSCSLVWVPPAGEQMEWAAWPYEEEMCNYWLPLDTSPMYLASAPQGWTSALEGMRPIHATAHATLMAEVAQAADANGATSSEVYEAELSELHRKVSGFQWVPAKLRRQWHHDVTAAFSAARQSKLGTPVVLGFFHPNIGVEESLFSKYPETVCERFERADGTQLGRLVIGTGPADMAVAVRAKADFDLSTSQDLGWADDHHADHVEYYNSGEGYVRSSGTGRTCYTLSVDPNTREATVKQ